MKQNINILKRLVHQTFTRSKSNFTARWLVTQQTTVSEKKQYQNKYRPNLENFGNSSANIQESARHAARSAHPADRGTGHAASLPCCSTTWARRTPDRRHCRWRMLSQTAIRTWQRRQACRREEAENVRYFEYKYRPEFDKKRAETIKQIQNHIIFNGTAMH